MIEARDVSVAIGGKRIVANVDFETRPGEIAAIVELRGKRRVLRSDCRKAADCSDVQIRGVRPIDVAAADAFQRRIERAIGAGSCRGKHGAASYQRGEQMAKGSARPGCLC